MGNRPSCVRKQNNTNAQKHAESSVNKSSSNTNHNSETKKELPKTKPEPKKSKSQELNKTDSNIKSSNSSKIKPETSKTVTGSHESQQKRKPTTETDYDDEEFSLSKLRARNQAATQNNPPTHPTYIKPGISYADAARSANEIKICPLNPQQPSGSAHTRGTDHENEEFSLARLYANKQTKPPSNQKINERKTTQQKKSNPEPSKVTPGISYADALRTSDIKRLKQEKAKLKSVSSFCLLCQKQKAPLVKDHLDAKIKQLIGNHPAKTVTLTLTLQTSGIFHINISLTKAGNYIGCLLATENAISTLSRTPEFTEYFKILIANDEKTVKEKEHLVHPAITLTRHKE